MANTPLSGFRLDSQIKARLKKAAAAQNSNQSAIVREALNLYFQSQNKKILRAA